MISYEAIIAQIELAVQQAKHAQSEQQMREQLTAVQALCEVVPVSYTHLTLPTITAV